MSTISSATEQRANIHGPGTLQAVATAAKRLWVAYLTWRVAQAITLLRTMSDQELNEIGLSRSDSPATTTSAQVGAGQDDSSE